MARKPSDIVQPNLRIREELRRRLEQAAKKRGVSINYEMTSRLKESFDREELYALGKITEDMKIQWARWSTSLFHNEQRGDLVRAAEVLLVRLRAQPVSPEAIENAAEQVQKTIKAIKLHAEASARGISRGNQ